MQVCLKHMSKVEHAIRSLPEAPVKHIYWIVYNRDMIEYTKSIVSSIRGQDYLDEYVTVVAKGDSTKDRVNGSVYFDPNLLDLLGNGNV